jgi:penicillin-binding protein 2
MAWRVAVIGTLALVMFGIIFFRLWYLQILTGNHYLAEATSQKLRPLTVAAPRGEILARGGQTLVSSQTTAVVRIVPSKLPESVEGQLLAYGKVVKAVEKRSEPIEEEIKALQARLDGTGVSHTRAQRKQVHRERGELATLKRRLAKASALTVPRLSSSHRRLWSLFQRLGTLLKIRPQKIDEEVIQDVYQTRYAPVVIDSAVGQGPRTVLYERKREFPGVEEGPVATRTYPHGEMAAQVFGYVSAITGEELGSKVLKGVPAGTEVGQDGLELSYDSELRGTPGKKEIEVNPLGEPVGSVAKEVQPKPGYDLKTTIDLPLQIEAEEAFRKEIAAAQGRGRVADGGGFVAMDPLDGAVYAMGSYPSYDPSFFTKPFTPSAYQALTASQPYGVTGGEPLLNRAISGEYPTGSTFKPITAMGALEAGVITPGESFGTGHCVFEAEDKFCNSGHTDYGDRDLVEALEVSSDTYFFEVGQRANARGPVIQKMAHELGIGDRTGIDLPDELKGVVPESKWLRKLNEAEASCTRRKHGKPCGYVAEPGHEWTFGDNMNLAVGQGDLLTNPLQMAVAYSTLVDAYRNDGRGWRPTPHLGMQIDNSNGELVRVLKFPHAKRNVDLNPTYLDYVFEGIHDATVGAEGTSSDVWAGWNQAQHKTYGKTGTAEHLGQTEQAWYMCYIESETRPIVIAVTMEQGGFGDEAAAPIARLIASQWFHQKKKLVTGSSADA